MKRLLTLASLAAFVSFQVDAQPPAPPADELPLAIATQWAQATIAACKARGYNVTAEYMNTDLDLKLVMRADGARAGTVEIARRKAYSAVKSGMDSGQYAASVGFPPGKPFPRPAAGQPMVFPAAPNGDKNMIPLAGAVLVKVGGKTVGAVAVSGAPGGDKDEACARAGLTGIAGELK